MAISVKHAFQSAKGDGTDATLVRPSNWNADHTINMATNRVLGRLTAGPGTAEELPVTSYMMGLLNTADYAALSALLGLPTTGDAKLTFKSTADTGWVMANDGTIGDASSGATLAHATSTTALFAFFYNGFSDAICPVQLSSGGPTTRVAQGTATAAFNNHCRMVLPKALGRALIIAGTGAGLSARTLGTTGGAETHQLIAAELPVHAHSLSGAFAGTGSGTGSGTISGTWSCSGSTGNDTPDHAHNTGFPGTTGASDRGLGHTHSISGCTNASSTGGGNFATGYAQAQNTGAEATPDHLHTLGGTYGSGGALARHSHPASSIAVTLSSGACSVTTVSVTTSTTLTGNTGNIGSDGAHNNMQPWTAWNIMIRL